MRAVAQVALASAVALGSGAGHRLNAGVLRGGRRTAATSKNGAWNEKSAKTCENCENCPTKWSDCVPLPSPTMISLLAQVVISARQSWTGTTDLSNLSEHASIPPLPATGVVQV